MYQMKRMSPKMVVASRIAFTVLLCVGAVHGLKVQQARHVQNLQGKRFVNVGQDAAEAWDYAHSGGEESWDALGHCADVSGQSPIDFEQISDDDRVHSSEVLYYQFAPYTQPVEMRSVDHGLRATLDGDVGFVTIAGDAHVTNAISHTYKPTNIIVHSPSEHTFGGKRAQLELQVHLEEFVGDQPGDQVAIAAFGFNGVPSVSSGFLDALRQNGLPQADGDVTLVNGAQPASLEFTEVFGRNELAGAGRPGFWHYNGSLTSPPCSTDVKWYVRGDVLPASIDAIKEFRQAILAVSSAHQADPAGNSRVPQLVANRKIEWMTTQDAIAHPPPGRSGDEEWNALVDEAQRNIAAAHRAADGPLTDVDAVMENMTRQAANEKVESTVMGSALYSDYEVCLTNLKRIYTELATSEKTQALECKNVVAAKEAVDESDPNGGASRIEVVKVYNTQKVLCSEQVEVTERLTEQAAASKEECDRLAPAPSTAAPDSD